jgi:hypothetical protein
MLILLSTPACLLSFFLAYLCYRRSHYQQMLVLTLIGLFMLMLTAGLIISGYIMGVAIRAETADGLSIKRPINDMANIVSLEMLE